MRKTARDAYSEKFIRALKENDRNTLRVVPKADLHNHCVLGGSREFLQEKIGCRIEPIRCVLHSMQEMEDWSRQNIRPFFEGAAGRKLQMEAAFVQAKRDGVTVLEVGEDVWGLGQFFHDDIGELLGTFREMHTRIAPEMELRFQIGLSRHCSIPYLMGCLEKFWDRGDADARVYGGGQKSAGTKAPSGEHSANYVPVPPAGLPEYYSIDLYGDEFAQPIENFIPIYRQAEAQGIRLEAHVGEWGTADDVIKAVEVLHLDEVQHGIAAAQSEEAIRFLVKNRIRLNITPTSNVLLGRVKDLGSHPIRRLYRSGVDVTINSDDILMFDSDVSGEYLRLYQSGCLEAEELDDIRVNGLRKM